MFARAGVLFKGFPEAVRALAPKTYEVYRGIFESIPAVSTEIPGQLPGGDGSRRGDNGDVGRGRSDADSGNGARPASGGLARLFGGIEQAAGGQGRRADGDSDVATLAKYLSAEAGRRVDIRPETGGSQAQLQSANELEAVFGKRVVYFRSDDKVAPAGGAFVKQLPGVVFVNAEAKDPSWVIGHELLHDLGRAHPDIYAVLLRSMRERTKNSLANQARTRTRTDADARV